MRPNFVTFLDGSLRKQCRNFKKFGPTVLATCYKKEHLANLSTLRATELKNDYLSGSYAKLSLSDLLLNIKYGTNHRYSENIRNRLMDERVSTTFSPTSFGKTELLQTQLMYLAANNPKGRNLQMFHLSNSSSFSFAIRVSGS